MTQQMDRYWWIADRLYHFIAFTPENIHELMNYLEYFEVNARVCQINDRQYNIPGDELLGVQLFIIALLIRFGFVTEAVQFGAVILPHVRGYGSKLNYENRVRNDKPMLE